MNPDQERKAKIKQLEELEKELGFEFTRRQLETLISVMRSDLKHAVQLAFSKSYDAAEAHRIAHLHWHIMLKGIQKRSEIKW